MEHIFKTVCIRGYEFEVVVYAEIDTGGSNSWGSDEPKWYDIDIKDIRNQRRKKSVSNRLYDAIIEAYDDSIVEDFEMEYL